MINSKRILKLRREISKVVGQTKYIKFNIRTKEGLFLFNINDPGNAHKDKYTRIDKQVEGLELYDLSEYSIDDILIVGDGRSEPSIILDDVEDALKDKIIDGYLNNSDRPFRDFATDELIEISDIKT